MSLPTSLPSEIRTTAELLTISIDAETEQQIQKSFERLLQYFEIMNNADVAAKSESETQPSVVGALREDAAKPRENTEALIERSEEHEDNYVLIPNVL